MDSSTAAKSTTVGEAVPIHAEESVDGQDPPSVGEPPTDMVIPLATRSRTESYILHTDYPADPPIPGTEWPADPPIPDTNWSADPPVPDHPSADPPSRCTTLRQRLLHLKPEVVTQLRLALPIMASNFCQFMLLAVSTMVSGHAGHMAKIDLDGVTLANSMINAFGLSMAAGLATACDTLFSQGLGSQRPGRTGVFLVRALLILNLVALLLTALHENFQPILIKVMRQPLEVSKAAATFMKDFRFGIVFYFNYIILARFLQAQGRVGPPLVAAVSGNALNIGTQVLLLYLHEHTPRTTAICQAAACALMALLEAVYLLGVYKNDVGAWTGLSALSLRSWGSFLWLAVCGMFHTSLEVVYWEVGTVLAGLMGVTALGVQAVLYLSETVLFITQMGVSIVVMHRLGRALGSGHEVKERARQIVSAGALIVTTMALLLFTLLMALRNVLALPFTSDPVIREKVALALPVVALCIGIDGYECLLAGVLRGCGRQRTGAWVVGTSYYFVALPVTVLLAFEAHIGVIGLWTGTLCGVVLTTARYLFIVWRLDWATEAEAAARRIQAGTRPAQLDDSVTSFERTDEFGDDSSLQTMGVAHEARPLLGANRQAQGRRCRCRLPPGVSRRLVAGRLALALLTLGVVVGGHVLSEWMAT